MRYIPTIIGSVFLVLTIGHSQENQLSSLTRGLIGHHFDGIVFQVFEDDQPTDKYLSMSLNCYEISKWESKGSITLIDLETNSSMESVVLVPFTHSTDDMPPGMFSIVHIDSDRIVCDVLSHIWGSDMRIDCERINNDVEYLPGKVLKSDQPIYKIKAFGHIHNADGGTSKIEWRQIKYIDLPYKKLGRWW